MRDLREGNKKLTGDGQFPCCVEFEYNWIIASNREVTMYNQKQSAKRILLGTHTLVFGMGIGCMLVVIFLGFFAAPICGIAVGSPLFFGMFTWIVNWMVPKLCEDLELDGDV